MLGKEKTKRRSRSYLLLLLVCSWLFFGMTIQAEEQDKRVLFISSYSYAREHVRLQMQGIQDTLGKEIVLDYEFMDSKRADSGQAWILFYEGLAYRLAAVEPYDVVILGDDAALKFALQYRKELFDGIPLVFEGVNSEELAMRAVEDPLIMGVIENSSIAKNIELGRKLFPNTTGVVIILDDSLTGRAERERFRRCAELFPRMNFMEINTSRLSGASLKYQLKRIPEDTLLLYSIMTEDADGIVYTNRQAVQIITRNANVPVFGLGEDGLGDGLLGGYVSSMYQSGAIAGQMTLDILNGMPMEKMERIVISPQIYRFDAQVMGEYGIRRSDLPEGTEIINSEVSFLEKYREVILPACVVLTMLIIIILVVSFDNRKRRGLMRELEDARKILEAASQHDFLTGIGNRNKFMSDLQMLVSDGKACSVFMIDIDDFKHINDSLGHTAGDEALKEVASRLRSISSQIMEPYRYAGDEFILILRSVQDKIVEKTAYQCRQVFTTPFLLAGKESKVCGSIGVASYPNDAENIEQLIVCADDAMYKVKKNGKNDFVIYGKM